MFQIRQLKPEMAEYFNRQFHISFINSQKEAQPQSSIMHRNREEIIALSSYKSTN